MDQTMLARSSSVTVTPSGRGILARKWPFWVSAMTSAPPSVLWKEAAGAAAGSLSVTGVVVSPAAASWSVTDSITVSGVCGLIGPDGGDRRQQQAQAQNQRQNAGEHLMLGLV